MFYEYNEKTGEGRVIPNTPVKDIHNFVKEILNAYISPRHNIATDKIAEEIEIKILELLDRLHNDKIYPPIKLPENW